ncbi:hypothetical protein PUN28_016361 [Cardiocondyla obscurior]|uniref:Uncharacterized protein n=1 Tax=Cardiocondyla obscurior TaxID=286306 RepID=A0AAW2EVV4_9HYME
MCTSSKECDITDSLSYDSYFCHSFTFLSLFLSLYLHSHSYSYPALPSGCRNIVVKLWSTIKSMFRIRILSYSLRTQTRDSRSRLGRSRGFFFFLFCSVLSDFSKRYRKRLERKEASRIKHRVNNCVKILQLKFQFQKQFLFS